MNMDYFLMSIIFSFLHECFDDVKEAIRRLPENLYNDRVFRIKRALDLSMRQQILPKEQWTKYEEVGQFLCV